MRDIFSSAPPCTQFHRHRPSSVALVTFLLSVLCPASAQGGLRTDNRTPAGFRGLLRRKGLPLRGLLRRTSKWEHLAHTCLSFFKGGPGLDVGMAQQRHQGSPLVFIRYSSARLVRKRAGRLGWFCPSDPVAWTMEKTASVEQSFQTSQCLKPCRKP